MKKTIVFKDTNRRLRVDVKSGVTKTRTSSISYGLASPCCLKPQKIKKYCEGCQKNIEGDNTHKIAKFGGEEYLVPISAFQKIEDNLKAKDEEIVVETVIPNEDVPLRINDAIIQTLYLTPAGKKITAEYDELVRVLDDLTAVVRIVQNKNEYEGLLIVDEGVAKIRLLADTNQVKSLPEIEIVTKANDKIVDLSRQVLLKNSSDYEFGTYEDRRTVMEMELIEQAVAGNLPDVPDAVAVDDSTEADAIAELEALAN